MMFIRASFASEDGTFLSPVSTAATILGIGIDFGAGVKFNPLDNAFFSIEFSCRDEWLITHLSVHWDVLRTEFVTTEPQKMNRNSLA